MGTKKGVKRKIIKRLELILVLLFVSNIVYANNIDFPDVKEEWAKEPVRWGALVSRDI